MMGYNWASVGNKWGVVGSVGNYWGVVGSVGNYRGVMDSVVDWLSNIWDGLTLVPHISNEAIVMVSVVGDNLDTTVRKLNSVFSLDNSMFILSLSLGKVSAVLISSSILVGKWLWGNLLLMVWSWGWVVWGRCWGIWGRSGGIANISWGSQGCSNKGRECKHLHV